MSDDVLVRVENVSKRFCRSLKRSLWYGLQDLGSELSGHRHGGGIGLPQNSANVTLRNDEFWAVKDVSFELRRGECLGLIGRNGAGKTTLLRMLNGLIKPDSGRIEMRGQVGALIALGAGFNPVLSGRENIMVNASILGLDYRKAKDKIDEIIEFSELSEFIDSPVQTYSSGMQVRLGFSVAASLNPDILILDEVLAVGDDAFVAKCWNRLGELRRLGTSFLLVSHQMNNIIRLSTHVAYLHKGSIVAGLDKFKAVMAYNEDVSRYLSSQIKVQENPLGTGQLRFGNIKVLDVESKVYDTGFSLYHDYNHKIEVQVINPDAESIKFVLEVKISDSSGVITQFTNEDYDWQLSCDQENAYIAFIIPSLYLNNQQANISLHLWSQDKTELYDWVKGLYIDFKGCPSVHGRCFLPVKWI